MYWINQWELLILQNKLKCASSKNLIRIFVRINPVYLRFDTNHFWY